MPRASLLIEKKASFSPKQNMTSDTLSSGVVPISSFDASDVDVEVLTLIHGDHLGRRFEAELLHHGLEVVLARALRTGRSVLTGKDRSEAASQRATDESGSRIPTRLLKVSRPVS